MSKARQFTAVPRSQQCQERINSRYRCTRERNHPGRCANLKAYYAEIRRDSDYQAWKQGR
jgi:hypothetical protein